MKNKRDQYLKEMVDAAKAVVAAEDGEVAAAVNELNKACYRLGWIDSYITHNKEVVMKRLSYIEVAVTVIVLWIVVFAITHAVQAHTPAEQIIQQVDPVAAQPNGDTAGLDLHFTHSELQEIRVAGGLTVRQIQRINQPPPPAAASSTSARAAGGRPPAPRVVQAGPLAEQWRTLVGTYFPANKVDQALRVIWCESRGNADAKNPGSSASGLFQHLGRFWDARSAKAGWSGANIFDPEANVAVGRWLFDSTGGWHHWAASKHCHGYN